MSSQNSGRQYDKQHAVTVIASHPLAAHRFVDYTGSYPDERFGGARGVQGVSENAADTGEAVSCITAYSALVEGSESLAFGDYVKASTQGYASLGTAADHDAIALGACTQIGQLVECRIK